VIAGPAAPLRPRSRPGRASPLRVRPAAAARGAPLTPAAARPRLTRDLAPPHKSGMFRPAAPARIRGPVLV